MNARFLILTTLLVLNAKGGESFPPDWGPKEARLVPNIWWREVEGTNYWLYPLLRWEDTYSKEDSRPLPGWKKVKGEVGDRNPEGIILRTDNREILLKRYPGTIFHTGQEITAYALSIGVIEIKDSDGVKRRIPAFDYGRRIPPPPLPRAIAPTNLPPATNKVEKASTNSSNEKRVFIK